MCKMRMVVVDACHVSVIGVHPSPVTPLTSDLYLLYPLFSNLVAMVLHCNVVAKSD